MVESFLQRLRWTGIRKPTWTSRSSNILDIWGSSNWVHDIEATNGDECVTAKNPASKFLIESIYCNLSGGNSIGSLSTGTDISDITYRHIYANNADPCFIKSNGGTGTVQNVAWDTVTVRNRLSSLHRF